MRILFVTATRVGDAVLSTGLLDHLLSRHPDARITVACGPAAAELFEALPGLERLIVLEKMVYSLHWLGFWAQCVRRRWDLVVDLRRAPLTYLLPSAETRHRTVKGEPTHRVIHLAKVLGLESDPPAPRLWTTAVHEKVAEERIGGDGPVLAVGPAANWRAKTWRPERFAELIGRLTGPGGILPGARAALFGRGDERPDVMPVIDSVPAKRRIDLIGGLHLLEVYAGLKRCAFYVGNDSGLMHMAAAAGIPTLGLFGPSREENYAPWGPLGAAVRAEAGFEDFRAPEYDHRTTGTLMDGLSVDMVETAARELWDRARGAS